MSLNQKTDDPGPAGRSGEREEPLIWDGEFTEKEKTASGRDGERGRQARKSAGMLVDQVRRVSSITRRLHWYQIRKHCFFFIRMDLLLGLVLAVLWCLDQEFTKTGSLVWDRVRTAVYLPEIQQVVYQVAAREGEILLQSEILPAVQVISAVAAGFFSLQVLGQMFSYFREDRRIRQILSPINEMALKADELSRMSFSEDKYQEIERALENIQPDQAGPGTPLSFRDSDLSGVEAAMNNLLMRMRDAYRQQARFVNDASHELRTPIAVILGYANMLDRWGKNDPKTLEEGIGAIKNEAEHMNHLVEQLLFLARGDSGKTTLDREMIDLCHLLREVYEESFMIDEQHRYRLSVPEEEIRISADPGLLKQAVRILTDNAAKYTGPGEEIVLSAGINEEGSPYLQVQDNGSGIAEEEIPHIFERFYRSDEVRSKPGTGLGLSIAKWIVDKHSGHFEVVSRQDLGTRIRIVFPGEDEAGN